MADAAAAARERHARLAKPPGSLGRLEELGARLAGIAGTCPPPRPDPAALVVFAGDHGVHARGVTPWPQSITASVAAAIAGGGGGAAVLARSVGASVEVVDVGIAGPTPAGVLDRKVRPGTRDLAAEPAMTGGECRAAVEVGAERAAAAVAAGARVLLCGEVGIANTTPSAAVIAAVTGRPAAEVTGRGSGVDDPTLARKIAVVEAAVARRPADALAALGGLELAALVGFVREGARLGVPVVLDGVITLAAALVAGVPDGCVASHLPVEPGGRVALDALGLEPLLDLDLRLGEGTGALLALPLLRAAADVLRDMATLDEL